MLTRLNDIEARVIGCLIEKSIVTPDPLTLNALTNACNQKSSRSPVMSLQQGEVQHALRMLEGRHLVQIKDDFKGRTEKYSQRLCSTRYSGLQLNDAEVAIICLLLLRGPQTPGELRARSGRLHTFDDNAEVVATLTGLIEREVDPLVVKLPRTPGRKDSEFMHLLCGPIDIDAHVAAAETTRLAASPRQGSVAELTERVERLEREVAELKARFGVESDGSGE